jgi:hypothetical protein
MVRGYFFASRKVRYNNVSEEQIMKKRKTVKILELLCCILPTVFWGLVLFSFEEKFLAITTLLCALIHESGHLICIFLTRGRNLSLKGVINGFRITTQGVRSYDEEILIYLSGPLTNILAFGICLIMSFTISDEFMTIGIINLATALSNLIPIRGYDGYGAIRAFIKKQGQSNVALNALSGISSALTFIFCLFSLYLIDRYGGGYWIFAVFFVSMLKELKVGLGE